MVLKLEKGLKEMRSATSLKPAKIDKGSPLIPIERLIDLEAIVNFEREGRTASAYLSRKGGNYQFTFGWYAKGINPSRTIEKFTMVAESAADGLLDFPQNERLTLHYSSFAGCNGRVQELSSKGRKVASLCMQMIVIDEIAKVQELSARLQRNEHRLMIYCTHTFSPTDIKATDLIQNFLMKADKLYQKYVVKEDIPVDKDFQEMLNKAFSEGFLGWEAILKTRMEMDVTPMQSSHLWDEYNRRFGNIVDEDAIPPQTILFDEEGQIYEETDIDNAYADIHVSSYPFIDNKVIPQADRQGMKINDKLVGVAVFADKPYGWSDYRDQIRYLWKAVFSKMADVELFVQITPANAAVINESANLIMRQSETNTSTSKHTDVKAEGKAKKAKEAQESMIDGSLPFAVGMAWVVHRRTQSEIDSAMLKLSKSFRSPAVVNVEKEYAWKIWTQTLPFALEKLLSKPFDRRLTYLHKEIPPMMGLTKPYTLHSRGVELITDEGNAAFFLDLLKHFNMLAFGATRSGKSVFVGRVLTEARLCGLPVIIIDIPPSKAASTFSFWCEAMGGIYFDVNEESINIFRRPDVSHLSDEDAEQWLTEHRYFLQSVLMEMVPDAKSNPTIRSMLVIALDMFFKDEPILDRYKDAERDGFGSEAWQHIPTLATFLDFFKKHRTELIGENQDEQSKSGSSLIERSISALLTTQVGIAIGRPCTIDSDNELMVYALRGLSDSSGSDAAILAMAAYSAAIRTTLKYPQSVLFVDEFSVLLKYPAIGDLISRLVANAAKAGIRVFMAAQDPDTLSNSAFGPKILQNVGIRVIGRIEDVARESFERILRIPPELIAKNADEDFKLNAAELYSSWLIDTAGNRSYARYYSPRTLLGMLANNPHESAAREAYFQYFNGDLFKAIHAFSTALARSIQQDIPIQTPEEYDAANTS
jgi:hypothetical protein